MQMCSSQGKIVDVSTMQSALPQGDASYGLCAAAVSQARDPQYLNDPHRSMWTVDNTGTWMGVLACGCGNGNWAVSPSNTVEQDKTFAHANCNLMCICR